MEALGSTLCRGPKVWGKGVRPGQIRSHSIYLFHFPQMVFKYGSHCQGVSHHPKTSIKFLLLVSYTGFLALFGSFPGSKVVKNPPANAGYTGNAVSQRIMTWLHRLSMYTYMYKYIYRERASLVGQRVKNRLAMQETGDMDSIPRSREIPWKRKWQPTPVFLPKNSHEQRSLVGYSSKGQKESDMTEPLNTHIYISVKTYIVSRVLSIHTHLPYLNSVMRKKEKCILQLLKQITLEFGLSAS